MEEEVYIEFKNGQGPYFSDTQINQLQKLIKSDIKETKENAESEIEELQQTLTELQQKINGTVLYEDVGATGTITLSDNAENYRYIEIYYYCQGVNPGNSHNYVKIENPKNKIASLSVTIKDASQKVIFIRTKNVQVQQDKLVVNGYGNWNTFQGMDEEQREAIYITKVVGYK